MSIEPVESIEVKGEQASAAHRPGAQDAVAVALPRVGHPRGLSGRLEGLSLPRQVVVLAFWPLLEQVLNFLVTYVDLIMANKIPDKAVSATNAIAVGGYVEWLIALVQSAVGIGSTAIVSRAIGARHRRVANAALGQSMVMAVIAGAMMGALVYAGAPQIAGFVQIKGESLSYCVQYLRVVSLAAPFSAIVLVGGACLRGSGDTRTPFFVLCAINFVNSTLTYTFVRAPAPFGGHEVAGIAAGTVVAYLIGAVIMVTVLLGGWGGLRLHMHRMRPDGHTMKRILRLGLPNLAESFFGMWVANYLVLRIVGQLKAESAPGAHMIAIRSEALSFMPGFALGVAGATLAGQYLGAGDPASAKKAVILCWKGAIAIMVTLGVFFVAIPGAIVHIATNDPSLLEQAAPALRIAGMVQVFFATAIVMSQGIRGAGDTRASFLLTFFSMYLLRMPLAWLFGVYFDWGLAGVWIGLCSEMVVRSGLFTWRFFHGGWMKVKV